MVKYHAHFPYEEIRLGRYHKEPKRQYYSDEEIMAAYIAWSDAPFNREKQWDIYCDIRDSFPRGTNARIARERSALN